MSTLWLERVLVQMVIAGGIAGCATSVPIPELSDPGRVGIAIDVSLTAPVGSFISRSPDQIFFAKVEGGTAVLQQQIIRSNFVRESRAYLLNVTPGSYVAVGAFFRGPMGTRGAYTTYFSQELIENSRVNAEPGELVYMGSYVVDQSVGLSGADAAQAHYQNVISPGAVTSGFLHLLGGDFHYRGGLVERKADEQSRIAFRTKATEDLRGTTWATRLK